MLKSKSSRSFISVPKRRLAPDGDCKAFLAGFPALPVQHHIPLDVVFSHPKHSLIRLSWHENPEP